MFKSYRAKMVAYWTVVLIGNIIGAAFLAGSAGAFFGWIYSLAFALSALPQARMSWKDGHSRGVADGTLLLWGLGEFAGVVYGFSLMQWPIIFNCILNTLFVGIIVWYRICPREDKKEIDMT